MFLSPIFFASIGLQIVVPQMGWSIVLFTLLLLVVAILSKVVGCGVGARVMGYTNRESMQIGVGMISRGEVALIVSSKGAAIGLMSTAFFGPVALGCRCNDNSDANLFKACFCKVEEVRRTGRKYAC